MAVILQCGHHLKRFSTFASGSAIGMIIDYCITMLLANFMQVNAVIALAGAMIISASVVFLFHARVTFAGRAENSVGRYVSFMLWSGVVFLLRALTLQILLKLGLSLSPALVWSMVMVSLINYCFSAAVIFAKAR